MWQQKAPQSARTILACAWLVAFAMYVPIFSIPPMEHIIKKELLLSHAQMGLLFSIPIIMLAAIAIPSGFVADKIGIRKAAGIGITIMAVGSFLKGTSTSFVALLAFICLYGVGFGLVYPNLPKLVGAWFPREKIGLATGIYSTGIMIGCALPLAITLPLVFPITNTFRGTFYIWSIPAIVAAIFWWIVVKEPSAHNSLQNQQISGGNKSPHLIWKNKSLWLAGLMLSFANLHFYTWSGWTPVLITMKGAAPDLAAVMTSLMGWIGIPIAFLMPWASYKVGLRKPFLWASAIILALASLSATYIPVLLFWPIIAIIAVTLGGSFAMILALPAEMVPKESVGRASGMMLSIGYIGGLVGPLLAGRILDVTGTLNLALIVLTGVALAWACIAFTIPETGPRDKLQERQ